MSAWQARTVAVAAMVLAGLYAVALNHPRLARSWDEWLAMVLAPALILSAVPLGRRLAAAAGDPRLAGVLLLAAGAKLVGTALRYYVTYGVYGFGDATGYINAGARYALQINEGYLALPEGRIIGTTFVDIVTGVVFLVTRPAPLVGYLVFSFAGFFGLYQFARAVAIAVPRAPLRVYAVLLLFMPSLVYWPSSIGKESWMLLTLGVAARGSAMLLARHRGALVPLVLGVGGAAMVRPHVALLVVIALGFARLVGGEGVASQPPVRRLLSLVVVVAVGAVVLNQAAVYFNVEDESVADAASSALSTAADRTAQGGSSFEAKAVQSPLDLPGATLTVLFRPWPHEAHNLQSLIASLEGIALLGVCVWRRQSLARVPATARANPFVAMAVLYCLMFVVAFSTFGNFGIITRQRVQVYPFFLLLLALPPLAARRSGAPRGRTAGRGAAGRDHTATTDMVLTNPLRTEGARTETAPTGTARTGSARTANARTETARTAGAGGKR